MPEQAQAPEQSDLDLMRSFVESHGKPPEIRDDEPRAPQAKTPPVQEPPVAPEAQDEPVDEGLDLDYETLAALGLAPAEQPAGEGDSEGDGTPSTSSNIDLSLFAKTLGIEASDLLMQDGELMVRTKVDGETATVPFAELRKGYQLQKHFTRQQEQFLEERRKWEEARQQQEQQFTQQASLAQQILEQEERQLNEQYTRDWKALRQEDPAEYAAQVAEYNQRLQDIKGRKTKLEQAMQQRWKEYHQQQQQAVQQRLQQEYAQFVEKTGWRKPEEFQANTQRLRNYLINQGGFAAEEVDAAGDHRALIIGEKARKYDELMAKIQTAKKKVAEAPAMPSGPAARQPTGKRSQTRQAQQQLRKTGSLDDAASVIKSLGIV